MRRVISRIGQNDENEDGGNNDMMRKTTVILGSLALWVAPLALTAQTAREWRDSLAVLNRQIDEHPRSTDLRLRKAAVNIELEQWEYAVEEYGHVLRIDPENLAALYYRAYANTHLRQYQLARSDYQSFLQLSPLHMEARLGLAMVNERMGRRTEALDQYNQLVEMFRDSAVCYAARAAFESTVDMTDAALYDWGEAIRLQPTNVDYVVTRVELLIGLNRKEEAREELEKALRRGVPRGVLRAWFEKCRTTTTR